MIEEKIEISEAIKLTLKYFAHFEHPLTLGELYRYLPTPVAMDELGAILNSECNEGRVSKIEAYYLLEGNATWVLKRKEKELRAKGWFLKAYKAAKVIKRFPFVRMVGISGSLSKGLIADGGDIDFFIITKENRLWIARTLLHLFKKLTYLTGRQHWYCMNYFLDESNLVLEEKNQFTAIELSTLIPLYGREYYLKLIASNHWLEAMLPNMVYNEAKSVPNVSIHWAEGVLGWDWLNKGLMKFTDWKWRRKWTRKKFDMSQYELAFKTRINESKNHPDNHQMKLLKHMHEC